MRRAPHSFPISSEDCQMLLLLEETGSLAAVAAAVRRDVSVVSRHVARLAREGALVEKVDGRWNVSTQGRRVAAWARDAIQTQSQALAACGTLRIVTTREFAARVLGPSLADLRARLATMRLTILSSGEGVESQILLGEADVGLDCGRPTDPAIRFRRVAPEPFVVAAAPAFWREHPVGTGRTSDAKLLQAPHLHYLRINASRLLGLSGEIPRVAAVFNDLAAMRAACESGAGWGIFPKYAVARELAQGTLQELRAFSSRIEPEQFGVWWLRDRRAAEAPVVELEKWLRTVSLN